VVCIRITSQTTLRSVGSAHQRRPRARNYRAVFPSVLMSFPVGCDHTDSSSTLLKPTEVIWLTTGRRMHQLPQQPLRVGSDLITPDLVVRDLGIYLDADASTRSHVMRTASACFAVLRQLQGIRRSIPMTVFQSLVSCLVLARLDYCNSILACIPLHLVRRLQSVMNAAARLVFSASKCDHITPHLHWLTVS